MAIVFHDPDDSCAPFPHRVVITRELASFVICAECDHYIMTPVQCPCSQNCHYLGELLADLAGTGYTGPIGPTEGPPSPRRQQ